MQSLSSNFTARLGIWWWPLGLLCGVLVAVGSLSYAPGGRLNVLVLWLLWAGLPLLGALVSLGYMLWSRHQPWLFRWRQQTLHWYPNPAQRWHMLWLLQAFWLWVGLGLLLGFWLLLLFSDLAFGWSSTLLDGDKALPLLQRLAAPWQMLWPSAVPDTALMEVTRYLRIAPQTNDVARAGDWWPFLMASLLCYNLLPRTLLAGVCYGCWHYQLHKRATAVTVQGQMSEASSQQSLPELQQAPLTDWQTAVKADWELAQGEGPHFGINNWQQDEQALAQLVAGQPAQLLWRVAANRSPVGEMADLIQQARQQGVRQQGVLVMTDNQTQDERHLHSWQQFARQHQLVWVGA